MSEQQITDYLKKYSINSKEQLAVHILELKRNTRPNVGLISELVYVLEDENSVFNSFSREKYPESLGFQYKRGKIFTYEPKENEEQGHTNLTIGAQILLQPQTEVISDSQQEKISSSFLDEVTEALENRVNSTRHKSRQGETHIVGDLEGINKPPYNFSAQKTEKEDNINATDPTVLGSYARTDLDPNLVFPKDSQIHFDITSFAGKTIPPIEVGIKEAQSTEKPPVFTYCKVNKNALEALSLRALYGHKKYNVNGADEDWQNFTRVPNAEEEYANAQFRHALQIGGEENEKEHLVSSAWNAISRLEIYLRKNLHN